MALAYSMDEGDTENGIDLGMKDSCEIILEKLCTLS
jgi:hypothetical protein